MKIAFILIKKNKENGKLFEHRNFENWNFEELFENESFKN